MKKYLKIIVIIIFIVLLSIIQTKPTMAMDKIFSDGKSFLEAGNKDENNYVNEKSLKDASSNIYNTFYVIGMILMAIVGIVLGMQFISSGVEGKAQVKEALIAYVIGCIVIFGAYGIWKLSIGVFKGADDFDSGSSYQITKSDKCSCGADIVSPPNEKRICPKAGIGNNGKIIDGILHKWDE